MRFLRIGEMGNEKPVVKIGEKLFDISSITTDINSDFLSQDIAKNKLTIETAFNGNKLPEICDNSLRIGSPIARPTAIICIGQNYAAHAAESGDNPPEIPIIFFKHPNTMVGPYDNVLVPPGAEKVDWEVELGVVIGRRCRYLDSPEQALEHIAGFVISNDVSERKYQVDDSGGQWSKGKCAETFNPVGPEFVTIDEVDFQNLRLWSKVNGEIRQDSNTNDMIFDVATIVYHLSHYMVLEPGDLINTGTPQGVALSGKFPYLKSGDIMEIGIDGLGPAQKQSVVGD